MNLKHIKEADSQKKRIVLRVDFNIATDTPFLHARFQGILPTLEYLLNQRATIIIVSHRGRPEGKRNQSFSLQKFIMPLSTATHKKVFFFDNFPKQTKLLHSLPPNSLVLLENIRFFPGEEKNDISFSKKLASLGEIYVNDAFASAHRIHASTVGITSYLPAYAGFHLFEEINKIDYHLHLSHSPRLAIIGGKKTADKIYVLERLLTLVDVIYIGGAIGNTFLKANKITIGDSEYDEHMMLQAQKIMQLAKRLKKRIYLPRDVMVSKNKKVRFVNVNQVEPHMRIVDIGHVSTQQLSNLIQEAQSIIWNGPLGIYENILTHRSTQELGVILNSVSVPILIGGGDTILALKNTSFTNPHLHISTGGGALLSYLSHGTLPGLFPLLHKLRYSK